VRWSPVAAVVVVGGEVVGGEVVGGGFVVGGFVVAAVVAVFVVVDGAAVVVVVVGVVVVVAGAVVVEVVDRSPKADVSAVVDQVGTGRVGGVAGGSVARSAVDVGPSVGGVVGWSDVVTCSESANASALGESSELAISPPVIAVRATSAMSAARNRFI
jgi:hypothetical protein